MSHYFDKKAKNYLKESDTFIWSLFRSREKGIIENLLSPKQGMKLLDLGSGAGFYSLYFKNKFNLNVTAVDSSPVMVNELIKNEITSYCCSVENLNLSSKYDLILAAGVFEFVLDPVKAMDKVIDCLEDQGRFVLLVPASGPIGMLYKLFHSLHNCPTIIRKMEFYQKIAHERGLKASKVYHPTFLSQVICFSKAI